jgi:hypothetical protein
MAKKDKSLGQELIEALEETATAEMTAEEARAFRASLAKPAKKQLSDEEKREEFRLFWAREKYKYGKSKDLEQILWLHLKATKMDEPEKFEQGLKHFGLKKIS